MKVLSVVRSVGRMSNVYNSGRAQCDNANESRRRHLVDIFRAGDPNARILRGQKMKSRRPIFVDSFCIAIMPQMWRIWLEKNMNYVEMDAIRSDANIGARKPTPWRYGRTMTFQTQKEWREREIKNARLTRDDDILDLQS